MKDRKKERKKKKVLRIETDKILIKKQHFVYDLFFSTLIENKKNEIVGTDIDFMVNSMWVTRIRHTQMRFKA